MDLGITYKEKTGNYSSADVRMLFWWHQKVRYTLEKEWF